MRDWDMVEWGVFDWLQGGHFLHLGDFAFGVNELDYAGLLLLLNSRICFRLLLS